MTVIDGSQAVPQIPVDLRAIDADFYAWTGHKAYGPTGHRRAARPPRAAGGDAAVHRRRPHDPHGRRDNESTWTDLPWKFEAGTSQIAEAIGLGAAVDWIGATRDRAHPRRTSRRWSPRRWPRWREVPGLTLHGPPDAADRGALVSFVLEGAHPHDVGEILGREGVCVRTGHHCTQPLMRRLGASATTRASFAVHNSSADIERLIAGLGTVASVLQL